VIDAPAALEQLCVNTVRTLSMDAVQKANSGHPGTPMALAPLAYRLFARHMRHDPQAPDWADRDRFVLSCGHASMLLYSMLHLTGYDVSMDQLQGFRQLHSPTAGHPERGELPGIETTTGPLGQGLANAVGMALAERMLADRYNVDGHTVVDHRTFVLASDGDLMEGVQAEAASLAGHLGLGRLVVFFDDNKITIDGTTDLAFTEDVAARYEAYGWQVLRLDDVDDLGAIDDVVEEALADEERPTLVVTRTHIGIGSPLQDSPKAHGAPLGDDNIRATKENYGWTGEPFHVPPAVREAFATVREAGAVARSDWQARLDAWRAGHPDLADEYARRLRGELPAGWDADLLAHDFEGSGKLATRQASGVAINLLAPHVPELVGGSADLAASNNTEIKGGGEVQAGSYGGRNLAFGVREHGMAAICNGMLAHGAMRPYGATFLVFSDYMRPSIRLAALMHLPTVFVFTHDSVWLGEDGPTHQPIEHLASLRAMPNLVTLRPAEANETLAAWKIALEQRDRPVAMLLTRQGLPPFQYGDGTLQRAAVERGAYVLRDPADGREPEVVLIGSGSEVALCLEAAERVERDGIAVRVVSMPSWELFAEQPASYRAEVLPPQVRARLSVEAGATMGWCRWVGEHGDSVGIDRFGLSAPGDQAAAALGIEAGNVAERARDLVRRVQADGGSDA
jgi:transketolase